MRWESGLALLATTLCVLAVSSCSPSTTSRSAVVSHSPDKFSGLSRPPNNVVSQEPGRCRLSDVRVSLEHPGQGLTGDFAVFAFRLRRGEPCAMARPISFRAIGADGGTLPSIHPLIARPTSPPLILVASPSAVNGSKVTTDVGVYVFGSNGNGMPDGCPLSRAQSAYKWRVSMAGSSVVTALSNPRSIGELEACLVSKYGFAVSYQALDRNLPAI
jgi:hypothetical protein